MYIRRASSFFAHRRGFDLLIRIAANTSPQERLGCERKMKLFPTPSSAQDNERRRPGRTHQVGSRPTWLAFLALLRHWASAYSKACVLGQIKRQPSTHTHTHSLSRFFLCTRGNRSCKRRVVCFVCVSLGLDERQRARKKSIRRHLRRQPPCLSNSSPRRLWCIQKMHFSESRLSSFSPPLAECKLEARKI